MEPIFVGVLSFFVAFIALCILLPMMNLTQLVK